MNCAFHPQAQASAYCRTCGKALCENCTRPVRGVVYCEECLAQRVEGAPSAAGAAPAAAQAPVRVAESPNPAIAGILAGLLPFGVSMMYCGEYARAALHAGVFFGLIAALSSIHGDIEVIFGLGLSFWYFFMIFDSVRVARAKMYGQPIPDVFGMGVSSPAAPAEGAGQPEQAVATGKATPKPPMGAIILIGLGVLFLLSTMDFFQFHWIGSFWPLLLIFIGAYLFWKRYSCGTQCHCLRCMAGCSMGSAVLITLGTLFLLNEWSWRFGFHRTWPLLLVVIGVVSFLRSNGPMEGHIEKPPAPAIPAVTSEAHNG